MKTLLTTAALAIAFAAPVAEARTAQHRQTSHVSNGVQAKAGAKKKAGKAIHKKSAKKAHGKGA